MNVKLQNPQSIKPRLVIRVFIYGGILGLIFGASVMYAFLRIVHNSTELETHTQTYTDKQWLDFQENIELKREIAILKDSIAKFSVTYKNNLTDSVDNKNY